MVGVSSSTSRKPVLILDGGLGTTLEDAFLKDISTCLWSSKPIEDDPETIIAAHMAFLRAGADIILSATYQCSFATFERSGYTRDDGVRIMRKAITLAAEARTRYMYEQTHASCAPREIKIALSLGPFGATLSPAQEFDGFYPPPYGPRGFLADQENYNSFPDSEEGKQHEREAIDALTRFHLERLRVFAGDAEAWQTINYVAFETVPLVREVEAIKKAVGALEKEIGEESMKPWWISTVYPGGQFPQERTRGSDRLGVDDVVKAALHHARDDERVRPAIPWGLGINCTDPRSLATLLYQMTDAVEDICQNGTIPWLVVYPNRGDVYDVSNKTWSSKVAHETGAEWAKRLYEAVQPVMERDVWRGLIAGGCCKTGPPEIAALAKEVKKK